MVRHRKSDLLKKGLFDGIPNLRWSKLYHKEEAEMHVEEAKEETVGQREKERE